MTSPDERRDAIAYLEVKSYGHEPAYMRAYELLTTDRYPMVRAQALGRWGRRGSGGGRYRVGAQGQGGGGLSGGGAEGFGRAGAAGRGVRADDDMGRQAAAGPLAELVTKAEEDDQVRISVRRALAQARSRRRIRADRRAAGQGRGGGAVCARSLVVATKQDFSYDYKAWLKWYLQSYLTGAGGGARGGAGVAAATGRVRRRCRRGRDRGVGSEPAATRP